MVLAILLIVGACDRSVVDEVEPELPAVDQSGCDSPGYLSTQLYGSIARQIQWSHEDLQCESMLRPDGEGVRLRFSGSAADSQLSIILALPELRRADTGPESPTVVTLTVDGSGRFFSTPSSQSCWSDITAHESIPGDGDRYEISGTLYCVAPLGEINGDGAITIPELEFRGIVDWSTT